MPRVNATDPAQVPSDVKAIFTEIEDAFGMVPNLFKTAAHFPPLLNANWEKVKAVMMGGTLSRKLKETIAVLVSRDNACAYCVEAHTGALKAIGISDEEVARKTGCVRRTVVRKLRVIRLIWSEGEGAQSS